MYNCTGFLGVLERLNNCLYYRCRLHLGAQKYDLDNQFFLDLATPQKWVTTKVRSIFFVKLYKVMPIAYKMVFGVAAYGSFGGLC